MMGGFAHHRYGMQLFVSRQAREDSHVPMESLLEDMLTAKAARDGGDVIPGTFTVEWLSHQTDPTVAYTLGYDGSGMRRDWVKGDLFVARCQAECLKRNAPSDTGSVQ